MNIKMFANKTCCAVVSVLLAIEMTGVGSLAYAAESASAGDAVQVEASQQAETNASSAREQAQVDASDGGATSTAASETKKVVPGADGPTSPTNASTHINTSVEELLSPEELSAAYSKLMARSMWDYTNATFADVLVYAEQYIGLPYVWGGKDLYRDGGFDCSGFVNWVYNNVCGLNINSDYTNAASLYYNYCTPVSEADARPGDIVFWKGTYQSIGYISHVGIYCGNGITIDAGDPIGYDRVTDITNMNGVPAERVYGRLVTLGSTSATLDSGVTKIRVSDQAYTGIACTPKPTVVNAGSVLSEGSDYWVSYEDNTNIGTASVVIHGIGRFAGQEARKTFSIYADNFSVGAFVVSSAVDGSQVLDVPGASKDEGTAVQLFARNDSDAQTFEFEKTDDGFYIIKNTRSGLYLTLYTTWAELRNTTAVTQQGYYGGLSQKWCIKSAGNGQYVISSAMDCSMVLDVSGGVAQNGSAVQAYTDNGTAAQRWSFVTPGCMQVVPNGVYVIKSAMNQNYVLDIAGASDANGANAQLYEANGTGAQAFALTWSNGYYAISNVSSGKYLDLENGSNQNGANVYQQGTSVRDSARWSLVGNPDGSFAFVNFASGTCMTVASPSAENFSNVQGAVRTGATGQKWFLEKSPLSAEAVSYGITLESMSILNGGSGAAHDAVTIALNPDIVERGDDYFYQFADCRGFTGQISADQMNRIIDNSGTGRNGVFSGRGQAIIDAAKAANINEMYLMAHIMTETAWGTSPQARGRDFAAGNATIKLNGRYYTKWCDGGRYYNFIGWGAYDSNPDTAYDFSRYYGWNSIELALMGAAEKVASNYLYNGQETVYEMRWNPDAASLGRVHQYCTDINWARTISSIMGYNYRLIGVTPSLSYRVPKYMQ